MARTRSKPGPKSKAKEATPEPTAATNSKSLPPSTSNPPKLFILPRDASKDARIATLDNPANDAPSRYFFCPEKGFHEFTRVAAPKKDCKSWLITSENGSSDHAEEQDGRIGSGYITKSADMFIATPIDLLFLILPALAPKNTKDAKQHFLALEDYLDTLMASSRHWRALMVQFPSLRDMVEKKMDTICDSVDAGDEKMYRISHEKLVAVLLKKAERVTKNGLPPSLEDKFIKNAFDVPVMNIKREHSSLNGVEPDMSTTSEQDSQPSTTASSESQASVDTTITTPDAGDAIPSTSALTTPPEFPHLLRIRTCLTYLTSTYIPPTLRSLIQPLISSSTTQDFAALDEHLAKIAKLKAEAAALRSISDNLSRKRAYEEDEEKIVEREEKKRRKEEEEKKKKSEGRGIKALKKADVSGMKKMSAFFTKVPKKA